MRGTIAIGLLAVLFALASAGPSLAQQVESKEVVTQTTTETAAGPKYLNLRYDEDFSYLDGGVGSYPEDYFDPIKNVKLNDDLTLSIGGEFRFQMDSITHGLFGARADTHDNFQLYRMFMHFDLKYQDTARLFVQFGSMLDGDHELGTRAIDENQLTVHQAFVDLMPFDVPLTLRLGRQELSYGKEQFVSPLEWSNVRRRFDAIKMIWEEEAWQLDLFASKPVVVRDDKADPWNDDACFYGAYFSYKGYDRHTLDLFAFAQDDKGDLRNPNGNAGDMYRYTVGATFDGTTDNFDYMAMAAAQWGEWAGDRIEAYAWSLKGGYTFADYTCKPRLGIGFDWASGDKNWRDGEVGTFDQLYPLGHAYNGYLDLVGRQNINTLYADISAWAVPDKVKTGIAFHTFWLNTKKDALYDAGGAAIRRDLTGTSGDEVGHELDLTVCWQMCPHSSLLLGYSHLWCDNFIVDSGPDEDPDYFYIQYAFKF